MFASPQAGWDALFALFRGPTYSRLPLDEALARFAPPSENDTAGYQRFVRERMGFTGDETLAELTDGQIAKLIDAIRTFEGWREGNTTIRKRAGQ